MADWQSLARRAARQAGVDPNIFVRLVRQESGGRADITSPAGAYGYTQLMPGTARGLGVNPRDPWQNMLGGAHYLKQQLNTFGNYSDALRAYNAGPGAVKASHGYSETNNYVRSILGGAAGRSTGTPPGGSTTAGTGAPAGPGQLRAPDLGGGTDVSALLAALGQRERPAPSSMGLPAPAFAAHPVMPAGYQSPVSSGGPAPKADISELLALARTQPGAATTASVPGGSPSPPGGGGATTPTGGTGKVTVAPGANRAGVTINPAVTNFVSRVAGLYGAPLTIGTGTHHSRLTVNGTVSDHWSGNGADIPLTGRALVKAGQDALIAAGMPAAKARRQTGGGFNIGGWQVIFNTDAPGWGDHTDHLHVGRRTR